MGSVGRDRVRSRPRGRRRGYDPSGRRFKKLTAQVAEGYVGKEVPAKYQKEYGKRYSEKEAEEVGRKVAGKRFWATYGKRRGAQIISTEVKKAK